MYNRYIGQTIKAIAEQNRETIRRVLCAKATVVWKKALKWEGKKPDAVVVLLSPDNPHRRELDRIIQQGQEAGVKVEVNVQ